MDYTRLNYEVNDEELDDLDIEERATCLYKIKQFFKKHADLFIKTGMVILRVAQFLVLDSLLNYGLQRTKNNVFSRQDKGWREALWVSVGFLGTLFITMGFSFYRKMEEQTKLAKQYLDIEESLNFSIRMVKRRICMVSTLQEFYNDDIDRDEIISKFLQKADNNALPYDSDINVDDIIQTTPKETIDENSEVLSWKFIKMLKRSLEVNLIKQYPDVFVQPYKCYCFGIPKILSCLCCLVDARVSRSIGEFASGIGQQRLNAREYEAEKENKRTLLTLKSEYEKYFGFLGIPFETNAYEDEPHIHIDLDTFVDIKGRTVKRNESIVIDDIRERSTTLRTTS